ncbi:CIS tube protein [Pseudokordiimonas caeni]|uniref:CIS tube protein n=1 Tax=Pseudokordiimonas caeni TaxID=2997908 RepID=UPI00281203BB|nr:hypothetical protein [Pseudokordiimonas caeni]
MAASPISSKLAKLKIEAFSDKAMASAISGGTFTALVNPDTIKETISVCYNNQNAWRNNGTGRVFNHFKPQEFELNFFLDGTGALGIDTLAADYVWNQVQLFRFVTTTRKDAASPPPYLKVSWGALFIHCQLERASVNYTVFDTDGTPLRANITAAMKTFADETLKKANDPDGTKAIAAAAGSSLAKLAAAAYGSAGYAAALAKVNGLTSSRSVTSDKTLSAPPATALKANSS